MGRYHGGLSIQETKHAMHREFMNNMMGRAPVGAREAYQQTRDQYQEDPNGKGENVMDKEQLEQLNEAFDTKLVNTMKAMKTVLEQSTQARIDELEARLNRPPNGGDSGMIEAENREYTESFRAFTRRGEVNASLATGSDPNGGYAVPTELDRNMIKLAVNDVPMRRVANVVSVSTPNYVKLVDKKGVASGWVGETDARPETDTPQLAALTPFMGELYANPATTQTMLDDAVFDVEAWLSESLVEKFAADENTAFTSGDGILKAKGFLAYPVATTDDAARPLGTLRYIATGAAADFATASATVSPADVLIDLIYSLKAGYRQNAVFMLNSTTLGKIRKFKDTDGQYIWQPSLITGQPSTLLGYPCIENEDMPGIGAGAFPIAFGDFKRGYTIVDRIGTRVLRDPYTNKPYVHFYTTKRVGGFLTDSNAIRLLKIAAN